MAASGSNPLDAGAIVAPLATATAGRALEEKTSASSGTSHAPLSSRPALRQSKAVMNEHLKAFVRQFFALTAAVEPMLNPLSGWGRETDGKEGWNAMWQALHIRKEETYILDGDPNIEFRLLTNDYKKEIDGFLNEYYPRTMSDPSINRSPEFIIRTIRLLILNIEHHLTGKPEKKKQHLEAVKKVCLYILNQGVEWANDTKLWTKIFANQAHYFSFCDLLENIKNRLTKDIKKLEKDLEDHKLPHSLQDLQAVEQDLSKTWPLTLLQRLIARPIPSNFLTDSKLVKLFENESLTFQEFKDSTVSKHLKAVVIDPKNPTDPSTFNIVKHIFIGTARKKLRQALTAVAVKEAMTHAEGLSRSLTQASHRGLLTAGSDHPRLREGKTEERPADSRSASEDRDDTPAEARRATPLPHSMALTTAPQRALVPAATGGRQLSYSSLSSETTMVAERYHENLDHYASNRSLIVAVLPKCLRDIYNASGSYPSSVVTHVREYVESIVKAFYLQEQLVHLSENLKQSLAFHPHGGNILTKQFLPLPNLRDSAFATFTHIKTVSEQLEYLSGILRSEIPELNADFHWRLNGNQAIVLTDYMYTRIDTDGVASLRAMNASLSIESIRSDAVEALQSFASMTVQQIALQGMNVHISPLFQLFTPLISATMAMADQHRLAQSGADQRYLQFVDSMPLRHPLALPAPGDDDDDDDDDVEITVVDELSLTDIQAARLPKFHLTLQQIEQGNILERRSQFYLVIEQPRRVPTAEAKTELREILLTPEAKDWIVGRQIRGLRADTASSSSSQPSLDDQIRALNTLDEADKLHRTRLARESKELTERLTRTRELLPRFNRNEDLSAKLCQWWVPCTIIGIPLFLFAGLYRLINHGSIEQDLAQHHTLTQDETRLVAEIQTISDEDAAHERGLQRRAPETARLTELRRLQAQSASVDEVKRARATATALPLRSGSSQAPSATLFGSSGPHVTFEVKGDGSALAKECEACALAVLKKLNTESAINKVFETPNAALDTVLQPLLTTVTENKLILENKEQRAAIYSRVVNALLDPGKCPPFKKALDRVRIAAQTQHKFSLLSYDDEQLNIALNASLESSAGLPTFKNEDLRKFIILQLKSEIAAQKPASAPARAAAH